MSALHCSDLSHSEPWSHPESSAKAHPLPCWSHPTPWESGMGAGELCQCQNPQEFYIKKNKCSILWDFIFHNTKKLSNRPSYLLFFWRQLSLEKWGRKRLFTMWRWKTLFFQTFSPTKSSNSLDSSQANTQGSLDFCLPYSQNPELYYFPIFQKQVPKTQQHYHFN